MHFETSVASGTGRPLAIERVGGFAQVGVKF
jgi:hypothetical protein